MLRKVNAFDFEFYNYVLSFSRNNSDDSFIFNVFT